MSDAYDPTADAKWLPRAYPSDASRRLAAFVLRVWRPGEEVRAAAERYRRLLAGESFAAVYGSFPSPNLASQEDDAVLAAAYADLLNGGPNDE